MLTAVLLITAGGVLLYLGGGAVLGVAGLVAPLPEGDRLVADPRLTLGVAALLWSLARSSFRIARLEEALLLVYLLYMGWRGFQGSDADWRSSAGGDGEEDRGLEPLS